MVKGNADRRRQQAQKRKDDKKEEIVRKQSGASRATAAEARARLLSDVRASGASDESLVAWVIAALHEDGTEKKDVCEAWFRTGHCPLKRCRSSHDASIAHLEGAGMVSQDPPTEAGGEDEEDAAHARGGGTAGSGSLPALDCVPLRGADPGGALVYDRYLRTHVRQENKLFFIAWGSKLVFDSANPTVFASYAASHADSAADGGGAAAGTAAVAGLSALSLMEQAVSPERSLRPVSRGRKAVARSVDQEVSEQRAAARSLSRPVVGSPQARAGLRALRAVSPAPVTRMGLGEVPVEPSSQVVVPSLSCRRCVLDFGSVEELRQHIKNH